MPRLARATLVEILENRITPATIFAVEVNGNLISFDSSAPQTLLLDVPITGLQPNEDIAAIDFRPATGGLYALGLIDTGVERAGRLYTLNVTTGVASLVGNTLFSPNLDDTRVWGFDFNPVADKIRLTSAFDANIRLNPVTGLIDLADANLNDPNSGESITGAAYDRNFGGTATTLYGFNQTTSELVRIGGVNGSPSPNTGVVTPIAKLTIGGFEIVTELANVGFDISSGGGGPETGWLVADTGDLRLYNVNLANGVLTDRGTVANGNGIYIAMAVQPYAPSPDISVDGKTATWTDVDGDLVTLKITKGILNGDLAMVPGEKGVGLFRLDLTDSDHAGTNVTITAKPGPTGGNGFVNIGRIDATGVDIGTVTLPGDISDIDAGNAGNVAPSIKALTVRSFGSVDSGLTLSGSSGFSTIEDGVGKIAIAGDFGGNLLLIGGKVGQILIGGDLNGTEALKPGVIAGDAKVAKLSIKGSVRGGGFSGGGIDLPAIPSVFIGGSIYGGELPGGGYLTFDATGSAKSTITILGSVLGGDGDLTGTISVAGQTTLKVGGSLSGGDGLSSGTITGIGDTTVLKSVTIGSITSGDGVGSGRIEATRLGTVLVKGNVIGSAENPVYIVGQGLVAPATAAAALAISKVTILGNFEFGNILAGVTAEHAPVTSDAAIGTVLISKNMIASSISAGIRPENGVFGDDDDQFAGGNAGNAAIIARIASVTIGGELAGTAGGAPDRFAIQAEQIGLVKLAKIKLPFTAGKDDFLVGFTNDVRVREF